MNKKAFTLLEVLVLVIVASIILFVAMPSFDKTRDSNDYNKMHSAMVAVGVASMQFQQDYTDSSTVLYGTVTNAMTTPACSVATSTTYEPNILVGCGYLKRINWNSDNYDLVACPKADTGTDATCDDAYAYLKLKVGGNADLCPLAKYTTTQEITYPSGGACNLGF
ncbi:MAG: hypothetical protein HOF38_05310 [Elusimicrobiaceae bacterium]|nr:hypothetical protein [Elusimicrobiaceae bacterium]MBT4008180.1 hypothetical protein [Elusimicrobiaceae bacterium]MBT4402520.1 hypothetical protein [Elusimicrobiaceae bacterium]MBT4439647.1 hypothetical protein [Elusimicrobiaceae bacterium]MBT5988059.1 hypothetical protein [Elusimicrobiaceae bacterium]